MAPFVGPTLAWLVDELRRGEQGPFYLGNVAVVEAQLVREGELLRLYEIRGGAFSGVQPEPDRPAATVGRVIFEVHSVDAFVDAMLDGKWQYGRILADDERLLPKIEGVTAEKLAKKGIVEAPLGAERASELARTVRKLGGTVRWSVYRIRREIVIRAFPPEGLTEENGLLGIIMYAIGAQDQAPARSLVSQRLPITLRVAPDRADHAARSLRENGFDAELLPKRQDP